MRHIAAISKQAAPAPAQNLLAKAQMLENFLALVTVLQQIRELVEKVRPE